MSTKKNIVPQLTSRLSLASLNQNQIELLQDSTLVNYVYQRPKSSSFNTSHVSQNSNSGIIQPQTSVQIGSSLNITKSQAEIPSYQNLDQTNNQILTSNNPTSMEYTHLPSNTPINLLSQLAARPFSVLRAVNQAENIIANKENKDGSIDSPSPIAQWFKGHERILQLKLQHPTDSSFATSLMTEFFTNDELTDQSINVLGRSANGYTNENLKGLDPVKMTSIKRTVLGYVDGSNKVKEEVWKCCIKAMKKKCLF